jgi:hypothetical protein
MNEKESIKNENIIRSIEDEKIRMLQKELNITKEQMNTILIEKEREMNTQLNDKIEKNNKSLEEITALMKTQTTNKSNVRGAEGESYFRNLALKTFCDCDNFEIVEKAKSPHCGDFWLKFDKFTIMVDSKNYIDTPVPARDRVKLKNDIVFNKNIKIAWLVSMDQPILCYSGYPFMINIEDGVCYCYINSLMKSENPGNLPRMAMYTCKLVYNQMLNIDSEINLLGKYQKNESRLKTILNRILVQNKERFTIINQLLENCKLSDTDLRDCLNEEIRDIQEKHIVIIESWFDDNTVKKEKGSLKTIDMFKRFISNDDNRDHGIDGDMFKQIVRSIKQLDESEIVRGKTDKAQYTIIGYGFKESTR